MSWADKRTPAMKWTPLVFTVSLWMGVTCYELVRDYSGQDFFQGWDFYGSWDNLTLGMSLEYILRMISLNSLQVMFGGWMKPMPRTKDSHMSMRPTMLLSKSITPAMSHTTRNATQWVNCSLEREGCLNLERRSVSPRRTPMRLGVSGWSMWWVREF